MDDPRKSKIDIRALVAHFQQESRMLLQREIIAPLLPDGRIRTRLGGMVYEFRLKGQFVGWGRFRPLNEREAEPLAEALPWERGGYLELFPALRVILLWPDLSAQKSGMWWALAFNESDSRQRFGFKAEPLPIFLCDPTSGAERFERIIARVDGNTLWFDGPDALADPTHAGWLRDTVDSSEKTEGYLPGLSGSERQALILWHMRQLEIAAQDQRSPEDTISLQNRQQQRTWLRTRHASNQLEERLRHELAKADATLHSYSQLTNPDGSPGHLVVEWSERGEIYHYRSTINPNMGVVSSGICLSDRDQDFDLTSLVHVMTEADRW